MQVEKVILQAVLAYIVLFVFSKLLGKKQIAQLEFSDYVIGISIGSIAAAMATEPEIPIYIFIIAMAVFALINIVITQISRKAVFVKKLMRGKPLILIEEGKINYKNLKKSNLDLNEVLAQCRIQGYFFIYDIEYCIFETSGDLSIMPTAKSRELTANDFNLPEEKCQLSKELIIDGKIIFKALLSINKDINWLLKVTDIKGKQDLDNILIASFEDSKKMLYLYFKDDTENKEIKVE